MKVALTLLCIAFAFALLLRLSENKFIFFPSRYPTGNWRPESYGLTLEDCFFETADGVKLHGWLLRNDEAIATMLFCHGNAGNIADRLDNLSRLSRLPLNVFIFDYRGYGRSEGAPSEQGVYLDAQAAYDYLTALPGVEKERLVVFGRSLGGAVAVDLATQRPFTALILESTFTSGTDMAKSAFGFLPVHLVMKSKLNSNDKIRQFAGPSLFVHGNSDRVVPFELGRKLFAVANEPKEFYEIPGGDHNDTYFVGGQAYFQKLFTFIKENVN